MNVVTDICITFTARGAVFLANLLPYEVVRSGLLFLLRCFLKIQPKHLTVAKENLRIAFPRRSEEERRQILRDHIIFLSRLLADTLRLPSVRRNWVERHISFPPEPNQFSIQPNEKEVGALIATGHLGSFELFAYSAGLLGYHLSFVVRNFSFPLLDRWWCRIREKSGNSVINRDGAYKKIVARLQRGEDVGLLFDQNVTRNHALFPKWFDCEAATTKALGFALLQTNAPLVASAMVYRGDGSYEVLWEPCEIDFIRDNEFMPREQKLLRITQIATDTFCRMIEEYPEQWFWFHRRWKTRPQEGDYPYS